MEMFLIIILSLIAGMINSAIAYNAGRKRSTQKALVAGYQRGYQDALK